MPFQFPEINFLPDDDKPKSVRNWRIRQAVVTCSAWFLITFCVFPALFGEPYQLPRVGTVAWASDLEATKTSLKQDIGELKESVDDTRAMMLEGMIIDAQRSWCNSHKDHAPPGVLAQRVRDLKSKYEKSIGKSIEIPSCDQV